MARSREFDDETVVRAAREVFWENGYGPTSLPQLEAATGLSRSSLYAAYGSKRGLFERAARSYLKEVMDPLMAPMEGPDPSQQALVDYFLALASWLRSSPRQVAQRGCMMLNTALELNDLDAEAVNMVRTFRQRVRAAILRCLLTMDGVKDPERTADVLAAGQAGLMVTARFDPQQAMDIAEALAADIRAW